MILPFGLYMLESPSTLIHLSKTRYEGTKLEKFNLHCNFSCSSFVSFGMDIEINIISINVFEILKTHIRVIIIKT